MDNAPDDFAPTEAQLHELDQASAAAVEAIRKSFTLFDEKTVGPAAITVSTDIIAHFLFSTFGKEILERPQLTAAAIQRVLNGMMSGLQERYDRPDRAEMN